MPDVAFLPAPDRETRRVSIRRVQPSGAPSDVVGHLVAANDEWLVVLPEDRGAVWVPRAEASAVRRIPERTVLPASDAEAVERVLDRTWPGLRRNRLGGWVLRAGLGATRRANSVLAVGNPELPFADAVAAAEQWYGAAVTLLAVLGGRTADEAMGAGFVPATETVVMIRPTAPTVERGFEVSDHPDDAWVRITGSRESLLVEATAAPASYVRDGATAAGRVAINGTWAVLSSIAVDPDARGRGLGRRVSRALMATAAERGARYLALQVEADNAVAMGLYSSLGFTEHHRYCYLTRPAAH